MGMFDWDPAYDIGVASMNREHQVLLQLMAKLQSVCDAGATKTAVVAAVDALAAFTVTHFRDEEALMERIGFADRKLHGIIHKQLLDKLDEHKRAFVASRESVLPPAFFHFLRSWLKSHIIGIDTKYATVARQQKSA
jgi:hemerythrin-like metal-binding protein